MGLPGLSPHGQPCSGPPTTAAAGPLTGYSGTRTAGPAVAATRAWCLASPWGPTRSPCNQRGGWCVAASRPAANESWVSTPASAVLAPRFDIWRPLDRELQVPQGSPTRGPHTVVVCLVGGFPQQRPGDGAARAEPGPVVDTVAGLTLLCSYSLEATSEMPFSPQGAHKDCRCMAA